MSNIISLAKKLPLAQRVERDMRMYNYDPNDPASEDAPNDCVGCTDPDSCTYDSSATVDNDNSTCSHHIALQPF